VKHFCRPAVLALTAALLAPSPDLRGESRGRPADPDHLLTQATQVFVGEVAETGTFEKYKRTVPTKARVLLSLKGRVPAGERAVTPKDPGKFAYFDVEFSPAAKGTVGVFYVGTRDQSDLLIGFRAVPDPSK
jgi:hypothetical protein